MKKGRVGQAAIIPDAIADRIQKKCRYDWQRAALGVLRYTGERVGAVRLLKVSDVYAGGGGAVPLPEITFRNETRKRSGGKPGGNRQVPVHQNLRQILKGYHPAGSVWLFPSPSDAARPISVRAIDAMFRDIVEKLELNSEGFSLHSYRRGFVTRLYNDGVSLRTIMAITGHKSLSSLQRYIDADPQRVRDAIANL